MASRDERAERLLGSAAGEEALAMFRELGFVARAGGEGYGYMIFPQRPIVAYDVASGALLNEYCVRFEDHSDLNQGPELPDADDVLAKWMALSADERGLISTANMDRPGRQLDPGQVRNNLRTLELWRARRRAGAEGQAA
ncbi:MAG: hypothetical protein ABR536_01855 [Solirubrobacterales bacterium]